MNVCWSFLWILIRLKKFPSIPRLLWILITNQYWILSNVSFCIYHHDHVIFLLLFSVNVMSKLIILKCHTICISEIKSAWLWCIMLFIYYWIWFANILSRIFAFMFKREIIRFPFTYCSCQILVSVLCWPHKVTETCSLIFCSLQQFV